MQQRSSDRMRSGRRCAGGTPNGPPISVLKNSVTRTHIPIGKLLTAVLACRSDADQPAQGAMRKKITDQTSVRTLKVRCDGTLTTMPPQNVSFPVTSSDRWPGALGSALVSPP